MNKKTTVRGFFLFLLINLLIFLDQFTKSLTLEHLKGQEDISIIDNVLKLTFVSNKGIAWGMFAGKVDILIISTGLISVLILFLIIKATFRINFYSNHLLTHNDDEISIKRLFKLNILQITLTVLLAGAIGNLIDRISLGYVVDMIYFELIDFPVFNVADVFITLSTIFFFILYGFIMEEDEIFDLFKSSKKWEIKDNKDIIKEPEDVSK